MNFTTRFRAQSDTRMVNSDGSVTCDESLDDDGYNYLFMGQADADSDMTCTGITYSEITVKGLEIPDAALYAYDATYSLAMALHTVMYDLEVQNVTGDHIRDALLNNVSFTGSSAEIVFSKGREGVDQYGQGDRGYGIDYEVYFFDPRGYHARVNDGLGAWSTVGIWLAENVLEPCDSTTNITCDDWVFNTADNSPPDDIAPIIEVQMDDATRTGLRVAGALCMALALAFLVVLELCKETKLVKATQPAMMQIVIIGALLACIRVIIATVDLTDSLCIAGLWLGHMSFALVFGALVMKTYRVDAVVNSGLKRVRVTTKDVQRVLLVVVFLFCVYLMAHTLYSRPHLAYEESFNGHTWIRLMKCANDNSQMGAALYAMEAVILAAGARLCWSTKDVPDAVNDSRYIAMGKIKCVSYKRFSHN